MPYFPPQTAPTQYFCPRCNAWFYPGILACCVLHAPGTCCHYGETPAPPPQSGRAIDLMTDPPRKNFF